MTRTTISSNRKELEDPNIPKKKKKKFKNLNLKLKMKFV